MKDIHISIALEASFPKRVLDCVADIISDLLPNAIPEFLQYADPSVGGADKCVVSVGFDIAAFDAKLRAALRAGGFELPERNDRFGHNGTPADGVTAPAGGKGGDSVNESSPEPAQ